MHISLRSLTERSLVHLISVYLFRHHLRPIYSRVPGLPYRC
nr:MAG TPA: hypothetical protein [Caudoviricetes sp.]